jgi:flagellar basal body-associated protein FliL
MYNEDMWTPKRTIWTIIAVVIGVILVGWAGYALSVALSGPKGVGDAIKQKNSAANWTSAQREFEERHQEILALDKKIALHKETLKSDPKNPVLQTNVTGVTSACMSAVADYNTDSRSYLMEDFKSSDLPYQINDNSPATDCK